MKSKVVLVVVLVLMCVLNSFAQTAKGWDVPVSKNQNASPSNTHALIIGISAYKNLPAQLKYADKDAMVFYNYLIASGVSPQNIHLLLNENALKGNIWAEVEYLLDVAKRGDKVYIYYSGHGDVEQKTVGRKAYLLPYDSDTHSYVSCAVGIPDLKDYCATLSASGVQLIFIGDACRVGNLVGGLEGISITATLLKEQWTDEIKILSCQPGQLSQESKEWGDGRGLFSYELINGLCGKADRNKNEEVTLRELEMYLLEKVPEAAYPGQQDPIIETKSKDFVISYLTPEIKSLASDQSSNLLASIDLKGSEVVLLEKVNESVKESYRNFQMCMDTANYVSMPPSEWSSLYSDEQQAMELLPSALYFFNQIPNEPQNMMLLAFMKRNLSAQLMNELQNFIQHKDQMIEMKDDGKSRDYSQLFLNSLLDKLKSVSAQAAALKQLIGNEKLKKLGFYSKAIALECYDPTHFSTMEKLNTMNSLIDSALVYEPELRDLNYMKGACLARLNQFSAAKKYYYRELELNPLHSFTYGQIAAVYYLESKQDSIHEVLRSYVRAAKSIEPDQKRDAHVFKALYYVTSSLLNMRMNDSARVYFDELVQMEMTEMDADQMTGMNFFISSYAATFGLCDLADEYYQKASASGNYDSSVLTSIALCHAGNGNKDEAIRYMELSLKHGDPVYYNVACVYSALKDEKNAVLNFESFLKKQKNTVPYKHILTDPDIEFLRTLKQFNVLMKKYFPEHQK